MYGGYDASVFPGVVESMSRKDWATTPVELQKVKDAFVKVSSSLESALIHSQSV